jgi:cyclopropane-fatty-acyl-phospholipid synthase
VRNIFPGSHSFLILDNFLDKAVRAKLEVLEVHNDRWSYHLTFRQWARNLEANKDYVQQTFGDFEYRKLRVSISGERLTGSSPARSIAID